MTNSGEPEQKMILSSRKYEKGTIFVRGYPEGTSGIECGIPAAGDHFISRLEAAPTESLSYGNLDFSDKKVFVFNELEQQNI
jgi:hypothetical protein